MKYIIISAILLFGASHMYAQLSIPEGYRQLSSSPANGKGMQIRECHLDGDDMIDYACIVEQNNAFSTYKLLVKLSSKNEQIELLLSNPSEFAVYPLPLQVKDKVLTLAYFIDGTAAFGCFFKLRYHSNGYLQLIGYDSEYRLPDGHVNKSYNLLTGAYHVTVQKQEEDQLQSYHYAGKKEPLTLFTDDLDFNALYQLDDAGSEFEP